MTRDLFPARIARFLQLQYTNHVPTRVIFLQLWISEMLKSSLVNLFSYTPETARSNQ